MAEHKHPEHQDGKPSIWQTPFVQKALPFLSSLAMHVGIIVIGIILFRAIPSMLKPRVDEVSYNEPHGTVIPQSPYMHENLFGAGNENTQARQDILDDPTLKGNEGDKAVGAAGKSGGGAGDDPSTDIAIGLNSNPFGKGNTQGNETGSGNGDGSDGQAPPFGPPTKGGTFVPPTGNPAHTIVFVCDGSGSMIDKIDALRGQMRQYIDTLNPTQFYTVLFFQEAGSTHPGNVIALSPTLLRATSDYKYRTSGFLDDVTARGGTEPVPAFKAAMALHPDIVYFLVDPSDFPDRPGMLQLARELNADHKTRICTIAFLDRSLEDEKFLKQLADENGGSYHLVQENDLNR